MTEQIEVTQADRDAVTAFHNAQLARILRGDRTLGENRDAIEQAFARHRIAAEQAAAATITELRAENARLREGMKPMLGLVAYVTGLDDHLRWTPEFTRYVNSEFNQIARATLESRSDG